MARIANLVSKLATVDRLEQHFGVQLPLHKIYQMMDYLDDKRIEKLKGICTEQVRQLHQEPLDVMFFDCTTLYFESFVEDELKQSGYSKDQKFK